MYMHACMLACMYNITKIIIKLVRVRINDFTKIYISR